MRRNRQRSVSTFGAIRGVPDWSKRRFLTEVPALTIENASTRCRVLGRGRLPTATGQHGRVKLDVRQKLLVERSVSAFYAPVLWRLGGLSDHQHRAARRRYQNRSPLQFPSPWRASDRSRIPWGPWAIMTGADGRERVKKSGNGGRVHWIQFVRWAHTAIRLAHYKLDKLTYAGRSKTQ